jgi:hypothetical protein
LAAAVAACEVCAWRAAAVALTAAAAAAAAANGGSSTAGRLAPASRASSAAAPGGGALEAADPMRASHCVTWLVNGGGGAGDGDAVTAVESAAMLWRAVVRSCRVDGAAVVVLCRGGVFSVHARGGWFFALCGWAAARNAPLRTHPLRLRCALQHLPA